MSRVLEALRISLIGLSVGVLAIGGCTGSNSNHDHGDHADHGDHDDHSHGDSDHDHAGHDHSHDQDDAEARMDVYTGVRGEIKSMPTDGIAGDDAKFRHAQIVDFKSADGSIPVTADGIAGMRSMTMPFPMADGVSLDGYSVGDKIKFDFEVSWDDGRASWEVTRIEKLDPSVEIDYENVKSEP